MKFDIALIKKYETVFAGMVLGVENATNWYDCGIPALRMVVNVPFVADGILALAFGEETTKSIDSDDFYTYTMKGIIYKVPEYGADKFPHSDTRMLIIGLESSDYHGSFDWLGDTTDYLNGLFRNNWVFDPDCGLSFYQPNPLNASFGHNMPPFAINKRYQKVRYGR